MIIYSWWIISNHVHLISEAVDHNLSDILRDFKSYTAKLLIKAIVENPESRRNGCLHYSNMQVKKNSIIQTYSSGNKVISTKKFKDFAFQKFDYIYFNPVAGMVEND